MENGSELLVGSQDFTASDLPEAIAAGKVRRVVAAGRPGDVVVFGGKVVHRGLPNPTEHSRTLVYDVYTAKWFEQGRDPTKEIYASGDM